MSDYIDIPIEIDDEDLEVITPPGVDPIDPPDIIGPIDPPDGDIPMVGEDDEISVFTKDNNYAIDDRLYIGDVPASCRNVVSDYLELLRNKKHSEAASLLLANKSMFLSIDKRILNILKNRLFAVINYIQDGNINKLNYLNYMNSEPLKSKPIGEGGWHFPDEHWISNSEALFEFRKIYVFNAPNGDGTAYVNGADFVSDLFSSDHPNKLVARMWRAKFEDQIELVAEPREGCKLYGYDIEGFDIVLEDTDDPNIKKFAMTDADVFITPNFFDPYRYDERDIVNTTFDATDSTVPTNVDEDDAWVNAGGNYRTDGAIVTDTDLVGADNGTNWIKK